MFRIEEAKVFSQKNISAKTIIEIAPVIILSTKDRKILEQTKLYRYIFEWGNYGDACTKTYKETKLNKST
jgi:hypothetical protein